MKPAPPVTTIVLTRGPGYLGRANGCSSPCGLYDAVGPRVGGVRLLDALAQSAADLRSLVGREPGEPLEALGQLLRRITREAQLVIEEGGQARIRREHRQARRARLVD